VTQNSSDLKKYDDSRPAIPADLRRAVEVESGHACAIHRCGEHTYLEIHHINGNREDNRVENLILLCDKHHKMAHAGVIDRRALREYKERLRENYRSELHSRVEQLEKLVQHLAKVDESYQIRPSEAPNPDLAQKSVASRPAVMALTLEQLALVRFERERGYYLDRGVSYRKEGARVELDALRQDDRLNADVVVEVRWIRKRYLDSAIHVQQLDAKVALYELMTGRKAQGVLILVVPKVSMTDEESVRQSVDAAAQSERKPELVVYSYDELGFDPGPVSAGLFTENIGKTDA
jgi:hypothetical protein